MTSTSDLRAAIADLDEVLETRPAVDHPGARLSRRGLELHRERLAELLVAAERSTVEVHLEGLAVSGHEIRIDVLARFLTQLQESVSAIAQALTGRVTERAPLPAGLRESAALSLSAVFPGSFGATLVGPRRPAEESLFSGVEEPTVLDRALRRTFEVMDASSRDQDMDEEPIVTLVASLGARAFGHLKRLSQHMGDEGLSAEFAWSAVESQVPQVTRFTVRGARRLNEVLTHNSATAETVTLVGLLGTASEIRNTVELQLSTGEIISARVLRDVVPRLRQFFGTRVRATFDVTRLVSQLTGVERRTHTLTDLESAPG